MLTFGDKMKKLTREQQLEGLEKAREKIRKKAEQRRKKNKQQEKT